MVVIKEDQIHQTEQVTLFLTLVILLLYTHLSVHIYINVIHKFHMYI